MLVRISTSISKGMVFFNPSPFFYRYIIHYLNVYHGFKLRFTIRACGAKREKSPEQGMHELLRLAYSLLMRFGIAMQTNCSSR